LGVVGPHFGEFVAAVTKKRKDYIKIPTQLFFLHNWEAKYQLIISIAVTNESASRFRSVHGYSVYMSELLANDADENQVTKVEYKEILSVANPSNNFRAC
jgi:hypothetical protein